MYQVKFNENVCKGCSLCAKICPQGIITRKDRISLKGYKIPEIVENQILKCTGCLLCEDNCLEGAVKVLKITSGVPLNSFIFH